MVNRIERRVPLLELAYQAIKQMIVTHELEPGRSVTESELGDKLGISRSPVRAALARLQEERFLEYEPWVGLKVAPFDAKYVRELYEIRRVLEGLCARKSVSLITDQEIDSLAASKDAIEPLLRAGQSAEWDELEPKFHQVIVERCDNEMLRALVHRMQDHWDRVRHAVGPAIARVKLEDFAENQVILDAMRTRDPTELQSAIETHISNVASRMLATFA